MDCRIKTITKYFRSAVAAQANMGIDFKIDRYYILDSKELMQGKINPDTCKKIFAELQKNNFDIENGSNKHNLAHIIVCAKTLKTIFEANEKKQNEKGELTGIFYIPAIIDATGMLIFDGSDNKLPWFPREYLHPIIEPKLAIGDAKAVDIFMSNNVDQVKNIESWSDYVEFFKELYETVTDSKFEQNKIRNMDIKESNFSLENNMYVFIDKTVSSTYHILNLYNHILENDQPKLLYENFVSTKPNNIVPLVKNDLSIMQMHCGQMGGEYPLSPSQREAVNHFNTMSEGEILAVNGPPGTGKTTLLQSIVADVYVKRAINKGRAPLIVASSTNNQAVTNIIASFGKIDKIGIFNLEERWIEGVSSFATYFPSASKINEAKKQKHQYTNQKGEFFVSEVEDKKNIEKSKIKLLQSCNEYFGSEYEDITDCQNKLHEELLFLEKSKNTLLSLAQEISGYDLNGETVDKHILYLETKIRGMQSIISKINQRVNEWEDYYKKIPFYCRFLKFIKHFAQKIQTKFRLFIDEEEQSFLNEYMSFDKIQEEYSYRYKDYKEIYSTFKAKKDKLEEIKKQYDDQLNLLIEHRIILHGIKDENKEQESPKYNLDIDYMGSLLDKKIRYVEFWLAVHYFECRWVNGEDELSEKQKGLNYKNILEKFYNRLSMITPCLVMTFYMLPKQFLAYGEQNKFYLYNYIDLLIVDEAGQVSPEIAAGAFSLAKKTIVVGDVYQIEPVWSVSKALDKSLALSNGVIESLDEYELLEKIGLNSSCSSVMKVAGKGCKYEKFNEKGLFLSEHRRCYDEIIEYCNTLVYKGNLQPMRGKGKEDKKLAIQQWPQMGFKQINTSSSTRKGSSRSNSLEAEQIVEWLKNNFELIVKAYPKDRIQDLVGILTPFKAQVRCIETELIKQMPNEHCKISIGTVHTFQGADRRIIIMSTVYGRQDGCYFIDSNKSLLNVAVSRAKDNFFMFGDINCLKDMQSSASGQLKKYICSNPL